MAQRSVTQTGTVVQGVNLRGSSNTQPAYAVGVTCGHLGPLEGSVKWSRCFETMDGMVVIGLALGAEAVNGTPNSASVPIEMTGYGPSGAIQKIRLRDVQGSFNVSNQAQANYLGLSPATAGSAPSIQTTGTDANVGLALQTKGTGAVYVGDGKRVCFNTTNACVSHAGGKLTCQTGGANIFSIEDGTGNMVLKGTLTQNGTP